MSAISTASLPVLSFTPDAWGVPFSEGAAGSARVDVRVAGVLLLGALVVGFDGADGRPLVLFES